MTDPVLTPLGSSLFVVWTDEQITLEFARIAEHTETITAEVEVVSQLTGHVHWSRFNLLAGQARAAVVKACIAAVPDRDWGGIVDRACKLVVRHLRAGVPAQALTPTAPEAEFVVDRWLVKGLVPRNQITVLYAGGGTGKSLLALAVAVSGLVGHPLSSVWTVGSLRRVLYLDWESHLEDHQERLWGLTVGLEALPQGSLLYRRLHRPITDYTDQLQAEVARQDIDLVVTDSLGAACGADPETNDAALRTLGALRAIASTHLVIAHVSKAHAEQDGPRSPFGGVYVVNTARSTIEARRLDAGEDTLTLTLHHRKSNVGRLMRPSGLTFSWSESGQITVTTAKADLQSAPLPLQILDVLKAGAQTVASISEVIDGNESSIKSALGRLANRGKVIRITDALGGRGKETQWGLVDRNRRIEEP